MITTSECLVDGDDGTAEIGHYVPADHSTLLLEENVHQQQRGDNYMKIEMNKSRDTAMSHPDSAQREYQGHRSGTTTVGENAAEAGESRTT